MFHQEGQKRQICNSLRAMIGAMIVFPIDYKGEKNLSQVTVWPIHPAGTSVSSGKCNKSGNSASH